MDCPVVDAHTLHTEVAGASLHRSNTLARERVEGGGHFPVPPTAFFFFFSLEGERFSLQITFPGEK